MGYFAFEGGVRTEEQPGDVPISAEEYAAAIAGVTSGKLVTISGGFAVVDPPEPKHWASADTGLYLGFFIDQPEGSIEVPSAPEDGRQVFSDGAWQGLSRQCLIDDVRTEAARRLDAIGAPYSPQERETWATQVTEAKAVLADANASTPLLNALAAADGTDVAAFAAKVLAKEAAFAAAAGAILAAQRMLSAMDPIPLDYADDAHWS